jgi:hypothetical protein
VAVFVVVEVVGERAQGPSICRACQPEAGRGAHGVEQISDQIG